MPMKSAALSLLMSVGLYEPARRLWRGMSADGLVPWKPLVPSEQYLECLLNCFGKLRSNSSAPQGDHGDDLGDYYEFGVSRGTSLACAYKAAKQLELNDMRLFGFDSFEGLPAEAAEEGWNPGAFASTLHATQRYLQQSHVDLERVTLIKGWFTDTLVPETRAEYGMQKASVIMVDCDTFSASCDALRFSEPLIQQQAVVIFDDWGSALDKNLIGQKEAFDEMLKAHPDLSPEPLPAYSAQSRVFHLTRCASAAVSAPIYAVLDYLCDAGVELVACADSLLVCAVL